MENKYSIFITLILFLSVAIMASAKDDLVRCEGTYLYRFQKSISLEQAEHEAKQYAMIQAIAKTFGEHISQQSFMEHNSSGESFSQLSESLVRGRWIKDIHEPKLKVLPFDDNGIGTIEVKVSFYAKKIERTSSIELKILRNGTTDNCEDDTFFGCNQKICAGKRGDGGDDLFMSVLSRKDGYIAIFYEDPSGVSCILPYLRAENEPFYVRKGERYVLFEKGEQTDTYHLMCGAGPEINKVYLLFSPNKFINHDLMREMKQKPFLKWLGEIQAYDDQMEVVGPVMIKINPIQ